MTTAAIMQPTYLPWAGYFGLMDKVDTFVFLDNVQFDRRSWQQRNRIKTANGEQWLTVPVISKGRRDQLIRDVEIDTEQKFAPSHIRSIEQNYAKAPYFNEFSRSILGVLEQEHSRLRDLTLTLIGAIADLLGIGTRCVTASDLEATGAKDELLANICEEIGADHYISPPGSKAYLEADTTFQDRGIGLSYFEFEHPVYRQMYDGFVPYMAVIDLMFNKGPSSLTLIRQGAGT
jgi:hypothetical protein